MFYSQIRDCDIANGNGIRVTLFVSGCRNRCQGCFQPETWNFTYGQLFDDDTINRIVQMLQRPYISGLTLLGGDPCEPENQRDLLPLLRRVHEECSGKSIWCYTGATLEELTDPTKRWFCKDTPEFLTYIDVLVDGPYIDAERDISLSFRGSANQRIIMLKE